MKKILLLFLAIFLAASCKSKMPLTVTNTIVEIDTIYVKETIIKKEAINDHWEKENLCDSITGLLKDFEREVSSGGNKVIIKSSGGVLTTNIKIVECLDSFIEEHKSSSRIDIQVKEVPVEVNKPWKSKWFWGSILINVVFIILILKKFTSWVSFIPI